MLAIIALFLTICALSTGSQAVQVDQTDDDCHHLNGECGGVRQYRCCAGEQLECVYEKPIHPEARGLCTKVCRVEGGYCGGHTIDPHVCCPGYTCVYDKPEIPDKTGVCQKNVTTY